MRTFFGLLSILIFAACAAPAPLRRPAEPIPDGAPEYLAAHAALWSSVEKAEAEGLLELYGFEQVGGESDYRAFFVVRTPRGTTAFFADGDAHFRRIEEGRGDSVPAAAVAPADLEWLRARVAVEVPFPATAREGTNEDSDVLDGLTTRVVVYRDGITHSARWYEPDAGDGPETREHQDRSRRAAPVVAVMRAVRAALPPEMFPAGGDDAFEHYASAPGY